MSIKNTLWTHSLFSDALTFIATYFGLNPDSPKNARAETGAGIIISFLSAAIDDVQDAMAEKYLNQNSNNDVKK
ncbi:MAG: hypothetical protein D6B27_00820 [Gammaproteobacteria bacterium]|nr:MAG: hypothetical protein D6B27_00820 [Gammaproteobacteria bacterium]